MAKKKKVNRSAEIRAYLKSNPKAGPKEVREALAKRGITVSDGLISQVKYKPSKKKKVRRKKAKRAAKRATNGRRKAKGKRRKKTRRVSGVQMNDLMAAKALADKLGGVAQAKQALEMVGKLLD